MACARELSTGAVANMQQNFALARLYNTRGEHACEESPTGAPRGRPYGVIGSRLMPGERHSR